MARPTKVTAPPKLTATQVHKKSFVETLFSLGKLGVSAFLAYVTSLGVGGLSTQNAVITIFSFHSVLTYLQVWLSAKGIDTTSFNAVVKLVVDLFNKVFHKKT